MELYEELLLSLISVLLIFLIGKVASAAPDAERRHADRAMERQPEEAELVAGIGGESALGSDRVGSGEVQEEEEEDEKPLAVEVKEREEERYEVDDDDDAVVAEEEPGKVNEVVEAGEREAGIEEKGGSLLYGEDEWEGIERSEVEKLFGVARDFVSSEKGGNALSKLSSDVQKQLYALHKVATEGPCYEPQPLALKVSARAKWHSWQRLGNMNPVVAMEQYVTLLSESIPEWMEEKHGVDREHEKGRDTMDASIPRSGKPDLADTSCIVVDDAMTDSKLLEQDQHLVAASSEILTRSQDLKHLDQDSHSATACTATGPLLLLVRIGDNIPSQLALSDQSGAFNFLLVNCGNRAVRFAKLAMSTFSQFADIAC